MKTMKRLLALLLVLAMTLSYLPAGALATENETVPVVEEAAEETTQPSVETEAPETTAAPTEEKETVPAETTAATEAMTEPAVTESVETEPEETVPAETEAGETVPVETEPEEIPETEPEIKSEISSETPEEEVENAPYLTYGWLSNDGNGFYEDGEHDGQGFSITPFDEMYHIYYVNIWNTETESYDASPVHVWSTDSRLHLDITEDVAEGEENGGYFYKVTVEDWNVTAEIYTELEDGTRVSFGMESKLPENAFYSSPEISVDNYIRDYRYHPFGENVVYFGFVSEYWTVTNAYLPEEIAEFATMEDLGDGLYKITMSQEATRSRNFRHFDIVLITDVSNEDGSHSDTWHNSLWCMPKDLEHRAYLPINADNEYFIYDEAIVRSYMSDEVDEWGNVIWQQEIVDSLPEGVSYDVASNTLTLENASLDRLRLCYHWYDEWSGNEGFDLPNGDLTIQLIGENTIVSDQNSALETTGDLRVNFVGNGSLYVSAINRTDNVNEDGVPNHFPAWFSHNAFLTFSENVTVRVEIQGEGLEPVWGDSGMIATRPAHLIAINGCMSGSLTVRDNATLTTVLPEGARENGPVLEEGETVWFGDTTPGGYSGIDGFRDIYMEGGTLNTQTLNLPVNYTEQGQWDWGGNYWQTGGTVNITAQGRYGKAEKYEWDEETEQNEFVGIVDHYHYGGIHANEGSELLIGGGTLNIDVIPTEEEHNSSSYFGGINVFNGKLEIHGGDINIHGDYYGVGICAGTHWDEEENAHGSEALINAGSTRIWTDHANDAHAIDVEPGSNLTINGGYVEATNCDYAFGGEVTFNNGDLNGNHSRFRADNQFTYNDGHIKLTNESMFIVGSAVQMHAGYMELEDSVLLCNGNMTFDGGVIVIRNENIDLSKENSMIVNGTFDICDEAYLEITDACVDSWGPVMLVNGVFHVIGGSMNLNSVREDASAIGIGGTLVMDSENEGGILFISGPEDGNVTGIETIDTGSMVLNDGILNLYHADLRVSSDTEINGTIINMDGGKVQCMFESDFVINDGGLYLVTGRESATDEWDTAFQMDHRSNLVINGGELYVEGTNFDTAIDACGNYTQTGGTVTAKIASENMEETHGLSVKGHIDISGGTLNTSGFYGIVNNYITEISEEGSFTVSGGVVNVHGLDIGMLLERETLFSGGSVNVTVDGWDVDPSEAEFIVGYGLFVNGGYSPEAQLTVTGGVHYVTLPKTLDFDKSNNVALGGMGNSYILGGKMYLSGDIAMFSGAMEDPDSGLHIGEDMDVYSLAGGKKLEMVYYTITLDEDYNYTNDPDLIAHTRYMRSFEEDNVAGNYVTLEGVEHAYDVVVTSGKSGSNTTWSIDDGVLRFEGVGGMFNFAPGNLAPWADLAPFINTVEFGGNLANIGAYALTGCGRLSTIKFLSNAPQIHEKAFAGVVADAFYPYGNETFTADVKQNYGGSIVWVQESGIVEVIRIVAETPQLFSGKSTALAAELSDKINGDVKVVWKLAEGDEAFAKLTYTDDTAKLTALTVTEKQTVTVTAVNANGVAQPVQLKVTIYPMAQSVSIYKGNEDVTGAKIKFDLNKSTMLNLTAGLNPSDGEAALTSIVTWSTSDEDIATVDEGVVTFTGEAGTVKITATAADGSKKKSVVTISAVKLIQNVEMVEDSVTDLVGGKSASFKAQDPETGKALSTAQIAWSVDDAFAPYASITAAGKLTTKAVAEAVEITITGKVVDNDEAYVNHVVTIHPAVVLVDIEREGTVVNGDTIYVNTANATEDDLPYVDLNAVLYPDGAMEGVSWKSSSNKIGTVEDGTVTAVWSGGKCKTGTVTITATANDGSKKKATVKVQFGVFAEEVAISEPASLEIASGDKATLTAVTVPAAPTKSGIVWSLKNSEDKTYATITKAGVLTAKTVYAPQDVTLVAASNDGRASAEITVTIVPKDSGILVIKSGQEYVTKTTQLVDLNQGGEITLSAYNLGTDTSETVTWSPLTTKYGEITVNEADNSVTVTLDKAGTITMTATAVDGRKANVSIKAAKLASEVVISEKSTGEQDNLTVASGKNMTLTAAVADASNTKVTWSVEPAAYAKISTSGKLTATSNLTQTQVVTVTATAKDGSGVSGSVDVEITPLAQGVQIHGYDGEITNTTVTHNLTEGDTAQLEAVVYPANASSEVTWKSSSTKIASVDEDGLVTCNKAGTVTITATAKDGSGKKATFKLTVVKLVEEVTITGNNFVAGGKSLTLKASVAPSDATNKSVIWSMSGDTTYATLSTSGVLKAKAVTAPKTIFVTATSADIGGESATYTVTIYPATTSVAILQDGEDVTGGKITVSVGEEISLEGACMPENAADEYTWKSSMTSVATVDAETGVVTAVKAGSATITCTAADGSGKKTTVKIVVE